MLLQGWEIALILFALTVMMVNVVNMVVQIKVLNKFDRVFTKSAFFAEKMMDYAEKQFDEILKDEE
jgi:hypothetical protein